MVDTERERVRVVVCDSIQAGSVRAAEDIAAIVREKAAAGQKCVLGLATGSSPLRVYRRLIEMHKNEGLSFAHCITFNLDEYYPMAPDDVNSYRRYMQENFFAHVDLDPANCHVPSGTVAPEELAAHCAAFDDAIAAAGGIDIQLMGIGRSGHIGFNEPGSVDTTRTRLVTLEHVTRADTAAAFGGFAHVPRRALTMGVRTILRSRRCLLLAWGIAKAPAVAAAVEGEVGPQCPASYLQRHDAAVFYIDAEAGQQLTRFKAPWLVRDVVWTPAERRRAVVWLAGVAGKPVLKLTDADYRAHGLDELASQPGGVYQLNIAVFNMMQATITGWPGGKPNADDSTRPERASPHPKRVVIFSPHPDDDVISMGGTLCRLVDQGHEVHVAYMTSGANAVADDLVAMFLSFAGAGSRWDSARATLAARKAARAALGGASPSVPGELTEGDKSLRAARAEVRRVEARAACEFVGLDPAKRCRFLDLPFYDRREYHRVTAIGDDDVDAVFAYLNEIKPHQVYAAGDLADPHGTHRLCLDAVFAAFRRLRAAPPAWVEECWVWLYRGAWEEHPLHEIVMAVPMSPDEVMRKRRAIFFHISQKDGAMFMGDDPREFWQRAEVRNATLAADYNRLGLAEYAAMEAFVRWHF